jgi:hypothetical protein
MFEKVLFPTDFSDVSKKALNYVKRLKSAGAKQIIVLRVINERKIECICQGAAWGGGPRCLDSLMGGLSSESVFGFL